MIRIVTLLLAIALTHVATAEQELLTNGDFEQGLTGWNPFWSRSGGGEVGIDTAEAHQGDQAVHIQYDGNEDWSFPQSKSLAVQPGDIYQLTGWLRIQGEGTASLSVILYDRQGKSLSWDFGGRPHGHGEQWRHVQRRFVVPQEGATILPRLMGQRRRRSLARRCVARQNRIHSRTPNSRVAGKPVHRNPYRFASRSIRAR